MDQLFSSIRMLDAGSIYPFERAVVANATFDSGDLLRHPFLVTPIAEDEFLLLEETKLFESIMASGIHHLPVLIVPQDELRITCPTLALTEFTEDDLRHLAARHPDQILLSVPESAGNFLAVHIAFPDRKASTVYLRNSSQTGCPASLDHLFAGIQVAGRYYPLINAVHDGDPLVRFNAGGTLLTMQDLALADLAAAATTGNLYPAGIIAVQPSFRVYNIDVPMSILAEDGSLEDKTAFLRGLITLRLQSQRTSQFSGHVYILNR